MNRFRCQYQIGEKTYESVTVDSENPITSVQILSSLAELAIKVYKNVSRKKGGKVALQVLKTHEFVMRDIHGRKNIGNGPMKSYYLDKRNKKKIKRSERVDIEFYGEFGIEDIHSPLNKYIQYYRKTKRWVSQS